MLAPTLLFILLARAAWCDVCTHRIPNRLVFGGAAAGLLLQALLPPGLAYFGFPVGQGMLTAVGGWLTGLGILLPMYLMRAMGAGDVKLLAMAGSFVGPVAIAEVAIWALLCGGLLALLVSLWNHRFRQAMHNIRFMFTDSAVRTMGSADGRFEAPPASAGTLPYAVAIAAGALLNLGLLHPLGWNLLGGA